MGRRRASIASLNVGAVEHFTDRFADLAIGEEVSAGAFRVLLRYLYTQEGVELMPE